MDHPPAVLDIDQKTMARRLWSRTGGNDFGRVGDTLQAALASHTEFIAAWRRHGAITVDAPSTWTRSSRSC